MKLTSAPVTTAVATVLGTVVLTACGAQATADQPSRARAADAERLTQQAQAYAGDPWEKRFREQFWADQHIRDSWNKCHLGENSPRPRGCDGTSLIPRG